MRLGRRGVLVIVAALVTLMGVGCSNPSSSSSSGPATHTFYYTVTATPGYPFPITVNFIKTPTGINWSTGVVTLPWTSPTYTWTTGQDVGIEATTTGFNNDSPIDSFTATVYEDGKVLSQVSGASSSISCLVATNPWLN
jgi:hypothetical protein